MSDYPIDDIAVQEAILVGAGMIVEAILQIKHCLCPKATRLRLQYSLKGDTKMGAPVSGTVGQVYEPTVTESNPAIGSIQPIGPLMYASDNTTVVSVDPNTGFATLASAGTANVSVIDQGNGLQDAVNFMVTGTTPPVATKLDLEYTLAASAKRRKK